MDALAHSGVYADDHRKSATHGFEGGKIEGILERRGDEDIGCGVKNAHIRFRQYEGDLPAHVEAFCERKKWRRILLPDNQSTYSSFPAQGKGFQQRRQAFCMPVVANQKKNYFVRMKAPAPASRFAKRE